MNSQSFDVGDTVRVRSTPTTQAAGVAGLIGSVYDIAILYISGGLVIGQPSEDPAINVFFKERNQQLWFESDLLEFVDHGAGA